MSDIEHLVKNQSVTPIGPFHDTYYHLVIDGYKVPYIKANLIPGTEDQWNLFLDNRFGMQCSDEELQKFGWFIANAMAIAAGYSCHGENCQPKNPFKVQMIGIETAEIGREEK